MAYDLTRIGDKEFEALCRALAVRVLGAGVQAFGDGPDGGRELMWDGAIAYPGSDRTRHWSGYGVLQAKYRRHNVGVKDLDWLRGQLRHEFAAWLNPASARMRRGRVPQHLIVTTNVRLSSVAGTGGIDEARSLLAEFANQLGLSGWAIWDANQISAYLDAYPEIAQRFSAFITASDVLAKAFEQQKKAAARKPTGNPAARCPSCGTQQRSQRMSALYAEERQYLSARHDGRTYRATSVSALGRRIAPPRVLGFPVLLGILVVCSGGCLLNAMDELLRLSLGGRHLPYRVTGLPPAKTLRPRSGQSVPRKSITSQRAMAHSTRRQLPTRAS